MVKIDKLKLWHIYTLNNLHDPTLSKYLTLHYITEWSLIYKLGQNWGNSTVYLNDHSIWLGELDVLTRIVNLWNYSEFKVKSINRKISSSELAMN